MDQVFQLPLFVLAVCHILLCLLLLAPSPVRLPTAQLLKKWCKSTSFSAVQNTLGVGLLALLVSCVLELRRHGERASRADVREVVATIDYLRAQVSCVLCALNLLALYTARVLANALCAADHNAKNLDAMKRQVKGLQAEYERATNDKGGETSTAGAAGGESAALKKQVDKLIVEKDSLQAALDAANKAAKTAEASVTAMKSQLKGFDSQFDKIMEENQILKRKLMHLGDNTFAAEVQKTKKDE